MNKMQELHPEGFACRETDDCKFVSCDGNLQCLGGVCQCNWVYTGPTGYYIQGKWMAPFLPQNYQEGGVYKFFGVDDLNYEFIYNGHNEWSYKEYDYNDGKLNEELNCQSENRVPIDKYGLPDLYSSNHCTKHTYFSTGELECEFEYKGSNEPESVKCFWSSASVPGSKVSISHERKDNIGKYYDKHGTLYLEEIFKENGIVEVLSYYVDKILYEKKYFQLRNDPNYDKETMPLRFKVKKVQHGPRLVYYRHNNQIKTLEEYNDDQLISVEEYDPDGQLLYKGSGKQCEGAFMNYHSNGELQEEGNYKDCKLDRICKFYQNGKLVKIGNYQEGLLKEILYERPIYTQFHGYVYYIMDSKYDYDPNNPIGIKIPEDIEKEMNQRKEWEKKLY